VGTFAYSSDYVNLVLYLLIHNIKQFVPMWMIADFSQQCVISVV